LENPFVWHRLSQVPLDQVKIPRIEDQGETLNPEMQLGSIPQCEQKQQFGIGALRLSFGATKLAFP
jgi:hypothetical protein